MAGNCSKENCYPDETGCNHEGCDVLSDCKYYKTNSKAEGEKNETAATDEAAAYVRIPWTGNTFGLKDLGFLSSTSKVILVGITGVASAGKTTFLATLYCLLRHGHKIGDYQFAGSLTLNGWENIAWYLSWKQNNDIQFPPHTSSNAGRVPGMLHLSFRNSAGDKKELIFTDAPGEWFDNWTFNQNDPNAEGAIWIHKNADAFLLFADCDMLSGEQLGKARKQTRLVADRLKQNLGNRPLGLIWSKSDILLDNEVKAQITDYIKNSTVNNYDEFETSVREVDDSKFHQNILKSIEWILFVLSEEVNSMPVVHQQKTEDLFLSKR
jgi:hypothetical protein